MSNQSGTPKTLYEACKMGLSVASGQDPVRRVEMIVEDYIRQRFAVAVLRYDYNKEAVSALNETLLAIKKGYPVSSDK